MPLLGLQPAGLLQTIFEDIEVTVAVIDREERIVFANKTALVLFGTNVDVNSVPFRDWRNNFRFEDASGHEIPIEKSCVMRAMRGERVASEQARVKLPNGDAKWVLAWAYQFHAMGLEGVMVLIMDETAEVDLRKAAAQLQRMDTLGALAAGLTHDFNNILHTISTNIALASGAQSCPPEVQVRLEQISEATNKASGLVKRLMQFSRTQKLDRRTLRVNDIVQDVLRLVRPLLQQNISLELDLAEDLPPIYADSSQMEQVMVNLIVNALGAMPDGGKLKVSTSATQQIPQASDQSNGQQFVRISVTDSGIGIPGELQSAIFEPFFTTKPDGKGTGLGLSSSYGIVRQHNGNIEVQSQPGQGSTFTVSIPAEQTFASSGTAG
jgi:signal transduction histidine kinase